MSGSTVTKRLMIDCGALPVRGEGPVDQMILPDFAVLSDGKKIDAVAVTHAHNDHYYGLPMVRGNLAPNAPIVGTHSSVVALRHIYDRELEMLEAGVTDEKLYDADAIKDIQRRLRGCRGEGEQTLLDLPVWVQSAAHIPGACSYTIKVEGQNLHFTGDWCKQDQTTIRGVRKLPRGWESDYDLGTDNTYGASPTVEGVTWKSEAKRLVDTCRQALLEGRRVLIYTFGLHRAGLIAHLLQQNYVTEYGPVFVDGSAVGFTRIFADVRSLWCRSDRPYVVDQIEFITSRRQREATLANDSGIWIVSSGMGGPGLGGSAMFREEMIGDPTALQVFTGYLAPDSDGFKLVEAAKRRRPGQTMELTFRERRQITDEWHDKTLPFNCQVDRYGLSGHSNFEDLIASHEESKAKLTVLSHGSVDALANVERTLLDRGCSRQLIRADQTPSFEIEL